MNNLSSLQEKVREAFLKLVPQISYERCQGHQIDVEKLIDSSLEQAWKAGADSAVDYIYIQSRKVIGDEVHKQELKEILKEARQQ